MQTIKKKKFDSSQIKETCYHKRISIQNCHLESQAQSQQREEDEEKSTVFAASKLKSHGFLNIS